jgi:hypothetical protein
MLSPNLLSFTKNMRTLFGVRMFFPSSAAHGAQIPQAFAQKRQAQHILRLPAAMPEIIRSAALR